MPVVLASVVEGGGIEAVVDAMGKLLQRTGLENVMLPCGPVLGRGGILSFV